jgi:hypothetical protein
LPDDARLVHEMGIRLEYYTPLVPVSDGFVDSNMNKAIILNSTKYRRVLHLDADVIPLANLDYLFHFSETGILKENVIIATKSTPMNGGFFMLTPSKEGFQDALELIHKKRPGKWDTVCGWGGVCYFEDPTTPPALTCAKTEGFRKFIYYGSNGDQGLFYIYPRFIRKSMTQILNNRLVHYGAGPNDTSIVERVDYYDEPERNPFINATNYTIPAENCHRYNACGRPSPFLHHMHFLITDVGHSQAKPHRYFMNGNHLDIFTQLQARHPWNGQIDDSNGLKINSPILLWWDTLLELEQRLDFNYSSLWVNATTDGLRWTKFK